VPYIHGFRKKECKEYNDHLSELVDQPIVWINFIYLIVLIYIKII